MNLDDLTPKLLDRVTRACGTPPDSDVVEMYLEHARYELGQHQPRTEVYEFTLGTNEDRVSILDNQGNPVHVVSCLGAYLKQNAPSSPLGQTYYNPSSDHPSWYDFINTGGYYREMPSIYHIAAKYREAYTKQVSFYRNEHEFIVVKPSYTNSVEGILVYTTPPTWEQIPPHYERLILDRALAEFIDDHLVDEAAGRVRIPTPHGSFEWDGGRALLALRDRLIDNFEEKIHGRSYFTSG